MDKDFLFDDESIFNAMRKAIRPEHVKSFDEDVKKYNKKKEEKDEKENDA